jgi:hypothetical protein
MDKELVKEVFVKLEGIVGSLTNVTALKEEFASLNQRRARIDEALDALLLK